MFSVQANFVEDENHVLYISLSIYDNVRKNISINNIMIDKNNDMDYLFKFLNQDYQIKLAKFVHTYNL